ncbi:MAG TPA: hypothetical protein VLK33_06000 [Terriglobales bacterium]|nr:hypothetical protein [Terriglobales bacterium]
MSLKAIRVELLISIALLPVLGCAANSSDKVQAASSNTSQNSSKATADSHFAFTEADIVAYEQGLTQEIALVRAARERGNNAKTSQDRAAAVQDEWEAATIPGGAQAAGLSIECYQKVRKAVNHVLETLDLQGKIDGPMEIDPEHVSAEMKQRLAKDAFGELLPTSAAALRLRMETLVPIWVRYMELTAVNG